jgi:hypothetical protein
MDGNLSHSDVISSNSRFSILVGTAYVVDWIKKLVKSKHVKEKMINDMFETIFVTIGM